MIQKFVHKQGPVHKGTGVPMPQMSLRELVHQHLYHKFQGEQIVAIQQLLCDMVSIMQEGQQVRLAELLHHVPVAVPFPPTCICGEFTWEPFCKVHPSA